MQGLNDPPGCGNQTKRTAAPTFDFSQLSPEGRIELAEQLWDSLDPHEKRSRGAPRRHKHVGHWALAERPPSRYARATFSAPRRASTLELLTSQRYVVCPRYLNVSEPYGFEKRWQ
jgi:hypothetical protein